MNKWLELILGLVLVIMPIVGALNSPESWGMATLTVLMGGIVLGVILIGLMFIMLGISDIAA